MSNSGGRLVSESGSQTDGLSVTRRGAMAFVGLMGLTLSSDAVTTMEYEGEDRLDDPDEVPV